jgi:peptide-methionine (S)-S-oxide reductase
MKGTMRMTQSTENRSGGTQTATLGGGCFWCLEAVFQRLQGVTDVVSGFSGGHVANPSYETVTMGGTGHAEVVQVHFDPSIISYRELLEVFFTTHDPTTLNRQGADVGPEYRSVIFYHSPEQEQTAREVMDEFTANKVWRNPIVTQVVPLDAFYPAGDYHRDYFNRNTREPYCQLVVAPKVAKLRAHFAEKLKQPDDRRA